MKTVNSATAKHCNQRARLPMAKGVIQNDSKSRKFSKWGLYNIAERKNGNN